MDSVHALSTTNAIEHILRHHAAADGWITLSRKENGQFRQYHYQIDQMNTVISEWIGEDVYFSQNTFYRPARRVDYVRQLRALYVDADCHLLNFTPEWTLGSMEEFLFGERVPEPNLVIFSGRGLALVWWLEPVPGHALPLWQAVEKYLIDAVKEWGADSKVSDAARVLRVAGTQNSRSGSTVTVQYRHDYRYVLRDLEREYLPPLKKRDKAAQVHRKLYRGYTLHYARMQDLIKLCELRDWEMAGYRETMLFLYRYWTACFVEDPRQALEDTLSLNEQFTQPLTTREVIRATRSAEKAYYAQSNPEANRIAREKGYPGAGYNLSNAKLISWLNITDKEQKQLQTIIGRDEKYHRKNTKRQKARRASGMVARGDYIGQAQKTRTEALRMHREGMTQKTIAQQLGINQSTVSRMLKISNI